MKTLYKENKNGTTARATEFYDFSSALRFMKEKQLQNYITTFPERTNHNKFIVYTWRKEQ